MRILFLKEKIWMREGRIFFIKLVQHCGRKWRSIMQVFVALGRQHNPVKPADREGRKRHEKNVLRNKPGPTSYASRRMETSSYHSAFDLFGKTRREYHSPHVADTMV